MKRFSLLLIALLLVLVVSSVYAQDTQLYLDGNANTICTAPVTIDLWVDYIPTDRELQSYDVRVEYDPGSVSATAAFDNGFFNTVGALILRNAACGPNIDYPVEDSCAFAVGQFLPSTVTGTASDPLAHITLTNVGANPSTVQIYEYSGSGIAPTPKLSDLDGFAIPHTIGPSIDIPGCPTGNDDYGDHLDSYDTLQGSNGPFHSVYPDTNSDSLPNSLDGNPAIWLGALVDAEANGIPGALANGDDASNQDDEDGAIPYQPQFWSVGVNGGAIDILLNSDVDTSNTAWLAVWFDWDNSGSFEPGELAISRSVTWTSTGQVPVTQRIDFDIPAPGVDKTQDLKYRVRLFDSETAPANIATAYGGGADNGEIEDHIIAVEDLPASMAYFNVARRGGNIFFEWQTASESGNAGFNIYVEDSAGSLQQLNDELIPSHVTDSNYPQEYDYLARGVEGDTFYIEDVSILLETRRHGPVAEGESDGAWVEAEAVDWAAIGAEHELKEMNRNLRENRLMAAALRGEPLARFSFMDSLRGGRGLFERPKKQVRINFLVEEDGLYRVTYNDLKAAGFEFKNTKADDLALFNQGEAIPMYVKSDKKFGSGSYLVFYGAAMDTLYTDTNVYTLTVDHGHALRIKEDSTIPSGQAAEFYMEDVLLGEPNEYMPQTAVADPWYDTEFFVRENKTETWDYQIFVDNLVDDAEGAALSIGLWGREGFTPLSHHFQIELNGQLVKDLLFGGWSDASFSERLPVGVVQEGDNTLQITHIGEAGAWWDYAYLDSYGLTYPRAFVARNGQLTFEANGDLFEISNLPSDSIQAYRVVDGVPSRLTKVEVSGTAGDYSARINGAAETATYLVAAEEALLKPVAIEAGRQYVDITSGSPDLVIISHEDFVSDLGDLVAARQAQGLRVLVVDSADIYAQYSGEVFDAQAIKEYIADMDAYYYLLVGGDTYDYRDYLGKGSISFIPSLYEQVGSKNDLMPVDPKYVDVDDDGVPDRAIGRFTVRTSQELQEMIAKTLSYQTNVAAEYGYGGTAIFAAGPGYKIASEQFASKLDGWDIERVYLDDTALADANLKLVAAIEEGSAMTTYLGHSSATVWSNGAFFTSADAENLNNLTKPTVVTQWGCSNTNYTDPFYNTMAHKFMTGDTGAAAVMGASGYSYSSSEIMLGTLLTPALVQQGMTIGEAMQTSKASMAQPEKHLNVLYGWNLLGDPTVQINP